MSIVAEFSIIKEQLDNSCDGRAKSESNFKNSLQCLVTGTSLDSDENMVIAGIFGWWDGWNRKLLMQSEKKESLGASRQHFIPYLEAIYFDSVSISWMLFYISLSSAIMARYPNRTEQRGYGIFWASKSTKKTQRQMKFGREDAFKKLCLASTPQIMNFQWQSTATALCDQRTWFRYDKNLFKMIRRPFQLLRRQLSSVNEALVDSYDRKHTYLRMSLTERCNFRCTYCMPLEGIDLTSSEKLMSFDEQKRAISIFSTLGMTKLRFTGGEPTLNKKLPELIRHARTNDAIQSIGITTNGTSTM